MSVRAMASNSKVNRRTVRAALQSAWPQPRKSMPPRASKLDELDALLRTKNITGGPGWLIDMLALTRQRLRGGTETQTHWSSQDCRTGRRRAAHPGTVLTTEASGRHGAVMGRRHRLCTGGMTQARMKPTGYGLRPVGGAPVNLAAVAELVDVVFCRPRPRRCMGRVVAGVVLVPSPHRASPRTAPR